jgi:glycosyltransferase involved in cell wall biosynthesis
MGGSQLNAIELAARVRDLGAETMIFGRPGVLCNRIQALGLEFIESPDPGRRPSIKIARELRSIAKARSIDILHGYEWPPSLECSAAAAVMPSARAVSTVMSMSVPPFIPTTVPLVVGTEQIGAYERARGRAQIHVLEPPVDLTHNVPSTESELAAFRRRWRVADERPLVVCVSRLANELKAEGLLSAIAAVAGPLSDLRLQLMIVGDGPARERIHQAAIAANATAPGSVIMTGELADPRAAYTAADVLLGMGSSALRALAFAKPLIVQGEKGFFELLDEQSWPRFAWQGWYGVGSDARGGVANLAEILRPLLPDRGERHKLGQFGADLVKERFSLEVAASKQLDIYSQTLTGQLRAAQTASFITSGRRFAGYYIRRKAAQLRGRRARDDFNARPLAAATPNALAGQAHDASRVLVYHAGASWHAVEGTDVRLATALGRRRQLLWVDPPESILSRLRTRRAIPTVSKVAPGVTRLHYIAPPGVSRPVVRTVARWTVVLLTKAYLRRSGWQAAAVIASSPDQILSHWRHADTHRLYFATDDFVAGAGLMGLDTRYLERAREKNLAAADTVLAVSTPLAKSLQRGSRAVLVFPNGCNVDLFARMDEVQASRRVDLASPIVGVFGQFNERLDLDYLEALAADGLSLLLVGPRAGRSPRFSHGFERLLQYNSVQWLDWQPAAELPTFMKHVAVGLTPYVNNQFNRASFPLKTLEYLAAGVPVVSTPLPAAELLDARVVRTAGSAADYVRAVRETIAASDRRLERLCRAQAREFSWDARADELELILSGQVHIDR